MDTAEMIVTKIDALRKPIDFDAIVSRLTDPAKKVSEAITKAETISCEVIIASRAGDSV